MNVLQSRESIHATSETARTLRKTEAARMRLGAVSLVVAGILFVLYPAIRPFSDETSLSGATAFASPEWLLAHILGMLGFTFIGLGLAGLYFASHSVTVACGKMRCLQLIHDIVDDAIVEISFLNKCRNRHHALLVIMIDAQG